MFAAVAQRNAKAHTRHLYEKMFYDWNCRQAFTPIVRDSEALSSAEESNGYGCVRRR